MFCFHKYGKIDERGYQYCEKCGLARHVPAVCSHEWETKETLDIGYEGHRVGKIYVLQCSNCGEIKNYKVTG